jgi:hypothetical protein
MGMVGEAQFELAREARIMGARSCAGKWEWLCPPRCPPVIYQGIVVSGAGLDERWVGQKPRGGA